MKSFNLAIVGGRDFKNYDMALKHFYRFLQDNMSELKGRELFIVSGGAIGADSIAELIADKFKIKKKIFKADWNNLDAQPCRVRYNKYGEPYNCLAGINRNKLIVNECDFALIFWNGNSKGTANDIELCKEYGKRFEVISY